MKIELILKSAFQSWGSLEPWTARRKTEDKPTSSAIYGLIGCAMGVHKDEPEKMEWIKENVHITIEDIDEIPVVTTDHQIVKEHENMVFKSQDGSTMSTRMPLIQKEYLTDTGRTVYLEGTKEVMTKILDYLVHPIYPYFLGRACCVPSTMIVKSVEE